MPLPSSLSSSSPANAPHHPNALVPAPVSAVTFDRVIMAGGSPLSRSVALSKHNARQSVERLASIVLFWIQLQHGHMCMTTGDANTVLPHLPADASLSLFGAHARQ